MNNKFKRVSVKNELGHTIYTWLPTGSFPPKEYGIRFGNGKSRKKKSNKLHKRRKK